jgi:superfamily I DNA and/or RNA helicase
VVEVCRDLVQSSSLPAGTVAARDIGVIAAFRQQVLKLRLALRAAGLSNVSVGSVEDFQVP